MPNKKLGNLKLASYFAFFIFLLIIVNPVFSDQCSSKSAVSSETFYRDISPDKAEKIIKSGPKDLIILDVRTKDEFNEKHISGAINIDYYSPDFTSKLEKLDRTKVYIVYCKSGFRSKKSTEIMKKLGFKRIYNMLGGINGWIEAGLPTVSEE